MRVAVIGSGYVGLITGVGLAAAGHEVSCIDAQAERIETIVGGRAPFHEPGLDALLSRQLREGRLTATTHLEEGVAGAEVSFIAVGTPSRPSGEIDLGFVEAGVTPGRHQAND